MTPKDTPHPDTAPKATGPHTVPASAGSGEIDGARGPIDVGGGPTDAGSGPTDLDGGPIEAVGGPTDTGGGPIAAGGTPTDTGRGLTDLDGRPTDAGRRPTVGALPHGNGAPAPSGAPRGAAAPGHPLGATAPAHSLGAPAPGHPPGAPAPTHPLGAPAPGNPPGAPAPGHPVRPHAQWHARVDCGPDVGAGFLVSRREVLTCAHVVRGAEETGVTVTFPQAAGLGPLTATVVARGAWGGGSTDPGDLAVLELERDVPLAHAEFAPPGDGYGDPPRRLLVYGFPARYDEGTLAEYRTTSAQRIAGEWVQLEAWNAHGQPLAPGFSGAAAVLADTGHVVGMVSAAAGDRAVRNGRMLPAAVMARSWSRLGELIPTHGFDRADKESLRRLVAAAESGGVACTADQLFSESVDPVSGPPLPPEGFPSLWAAAWYLFWEVDDAQAPARFATRLADFVDDTATRHALQHWPARAAHLTPPTPAPAAPPPTPPSPPSPPTSWSPIVVELERSGAGRGHLLVEVSAYRDGQRRVIGNRSLPKAQVRGYVAQRVDEAFHELPHGAQVLIAFVLPRELLSQPVEQWPRGADDPSPIGCLYPLVVMDRDRRRKGGLQHGLLRKWESLDGRPAADLYRVECGSSEDQGRLTVRLWEDGQMMGFTAPPKSARMKRLFSAGLNGSVPVMLWPRTGCGGDHDDGEPCTGGAFLDALVDYVQRLPPGELPLHIRALRKAVYLSPEPDEHWARDLTLLWEDPRCFPETPGHARSPVG
ncbi:trypsin-like peptidase domain-containing protein [Streptomyces sp. NPDC091292]|uniref:VMAP-C domain-containing protein n=1 Tax=Streptomyces sp. NPDC091292 TaxID=3365991 RepID=UPI003826BF6D